MKNKSVLQRSLQGLAIAGLSIFAMATAYAADALKVTPFNYVRAETDFQMKSYIDKFNCFQKFVHVREPYDVNGQVTVRGQRDTLYSWGVFDLNSALTISLPETKGRYQSLMIVNQNHSIKSVYSPTQVTLTKDSVGTRYATLVIRTFIDPNNEADLKAAHRLQNAVRIEQTDKGSFEVPDWQKEEVEEMRNKVMAVASTVSDATKFFGVKEELDPVYWMLGTAMGWGGLPAKDAMYAISVPKNNDGKTPYTLTVKDVPVGAFWSVTLYDGEGWMPVNKHNAYSFNNVTAKKNKDGSITIHFGGDPKADNFLPIVPGWNYIARMYKPSSEILDGSWSFPKAKQVK